MAPLIGGRRRRIRAAYDALCDAIATAHGASDAAREAARKAHLDALAELWLREAGLDAAAADPALRPLLHSPELAPVVLRIENDRAGSPPDHALPELDEIVRRAAHGAAGDMSGWLGKVGDLDAAGELPGLWRIGTGRLGAGAPEFAVAVPFLDEAHLQISSRPGSRPIAITLVETLVMRLMSQFQPGLVMAHVWDVGQLTGPLPGLHPLTRSGLLTVHDPTGLSQLLEELSDRIRRVHTRVLIDGHPSLRAMAADGKPRTEPWVVAVLVGNRQGLSDDDHRQLQRVARGGLACGVQLIMVDLPVTVAASVETIDLDDAGAARTSMTGRYVAVRPDPPLPSTELTNAGHAIAEAHEKWRSRVCTFEDLLPGEGEKPETSERHLQAVVGFAEGRKVIMSLDDASPHALIGGPSGSGKTNFLLAMIGSLVTRYDPDELELHLLDFKEGVSFAQFAPGRRDRTWLPHARLIGVNINTDREFGLALLQHLAGEMRRRAEAAKEHEVTKLEDLRREDQEKGRWPRIVAVIDEFQYLFSERDSVTKAAITLLEDVARRGRSQGIHLVLASQDVSSIEAFWGRPAIFEQFVLRIALPRARRVLHERNEATLDLPRWHAVINHESGMTHGNEIVRIPNASIKGTVDAVQKDLYEAFAEGRPEPRLFDGSRAPSVDALLTLLPEGLPVALVGQKIDVEGSSATVALGVAPGRNLGVLGAASRDAVRVLHAAAASWGRAFPAGAADIVIAPLAAGSHEPAAHLAERLGAHRPEIVRLEGFRERVEGLAAEVSVRLSGEERRPVVLVLYAADAADTVLDRSGTEALRKIIHFGPEVGVHVLGWWRSVPRLRALLTMGAAADDLGAWVALDVQGTELQPLLPGMLVHWSPRAGRGLFFDRAQHAAPEVIIVPEVGE